MSLVLLTSVVIVLTTPFHFGAQAAQVKILEGDALYVNPNTDVQVTCSVDDLRGKTVKWTLDGEDIALVAAGKTVVFVLFWGRPPLSWLKRLDELFRGLGPKGIRPGYSLRVCQIYTEHWGETQLNDLCGCMRLKDPSYETKYNITGAEASGGNFTLVLRNVSDADVGSIGCEVSSAAPAQLLLRIHESISKVVTSYYSEGSSEVRLNGKPFVHVQPHKSINLTCTAPQVRPRPSVTWYWRNLRKSNSQLEQVSIDETKKNLHDNKIYNFSSTLQINADFVQTLIEARKPDEVETTTSPMEETPSAAVITETSAVVADEDLVDSPSALQQQTPFDEKIQVVCLVDQMGEQLQKSFNLHIGPLDSGAEDLFCGSTMVMMVVTQFVLFNIFTSFENFV